MLYAQKDEADNCDNLKHTTDQSNLFCFLACGLGCTVTVGVKFKFNLYLLNFYIMCINYNQEKLNIRNPTLLTVTFYECGQQRTRQ